MDCKMADVYGLFLHTGPNLLNPLYVLQQMENYIMYNELGAGSNCVVYKGRKKGTLSFVALISTEKAMKHFIANHVGHRFQTCRKLLQ